MTNRININIIINVDIAPVLPNSNVVTKAMEFLQLFQKILLMIFHYQYLFELFALLTTLKI